ncbi:MAG: DUF416 family protein [Deltaproteobacteria bacterium]|nr:MAG: DUF416 family protein [Deltaproteobacteria bacterium]
MSFSPKMSLVKATPRCQRIGCGRLFIYNVDPAIAYRQREQTMKDIDEYEAFLTSKLDAWSPEQRVAFAAAMVDRWLHTYEKFSADEQWGDAVNLRRILDAVWGHVLERPLSPADCARYAAQIQESTPHLDDFDANEAMATCIILSEALDACGSSESATAAVRAALSGFEAAVPDWAFDPEAQPRMWRKIAARNELNKQLKLVERIGAMPSFDVASISALRKSLSTAELIGKASAPSKKSSAPTGLTNQAAFEQYRNMMTSQLKENPWEPPDGLAFRLAMKFTTPWMARYSRRQKTISGSYGRLADVFAQQALVARNIARDAADNRVPLWDSDTRQYVELIYQNPGNARRQIYGPAPWLRSITSLAMGRGQTPRPIRPGSLR